MSSLIIVIKPPIRPDLFVALHPHRLIGNLIEVMVLISGKMSEMSILSELIQVKTVAPN